MNLNDLLQRMDTCAAEKPRSVDIRGLGTVFLRSITIGEVDEQIVDEADKKNKSAIARRACRLLCDEEGNRLLDPDNAAHVAKMAKLPIRVLNQINTALLDEESGSAKN